MKKIVLIGAGGHSKSCIEIIEENNDFKIEAIVDPLTKDKKFQGYKVINNDDELKDIHKNINNAFICIGFIYKNNLTKRINIYKNLKKIGFNIPIIHKSFDINRIKADFKWNRRELNPCFLLAKQMFYH